MNDKSVKISRGRVVASLLAISVLCIILFILAYLILGSALNTVYGNLHPDIASHNNFILIIIQLMLVLFTFCFTAGLLSARVNKGFINNNKTALIVGGATGFLVSAIAEFSYFSVVGIWYFFISPNHSVNTSVGSLLLPLVTVLAVCLGIAMATALMGAAGSYYYKRLEDKAPGGRLSGKIPGLPGAAMLLLLIIVVPVIAVYLQPGILGPVHQHLSSDVKVSALRAGNDAIQITFDDGGSTIFKDGLPQLAKLDEDVPFTIWVNGKDASDADAIVKSGLNASISPEGGFIPVKGSSVFITGKDISPSDSDGIHLIVVCHFTNEKDMVVYDRRLA